MKPILCTILLPLFWLCTQPLSVTDTYENITNTTQIDGNWEFCSSDFEILFHNGMYVYDDLLLKNASQYNGENGKYNRRYFSKITASKIFSQILNIQNSKIIDKRFYRKESGLTLEDKSYECDTIAIKINSGDLAFDTCVNPFLCSVGKNNVNISILKDTVCFTHEYIMEKQILCNDTIEAVKCNEIVKYVKSKNNFDSYNWQDSCSTGTCNDEAHTATYGYQTINYILFLGWLCD